MSSGYGFRWHLLQRERQETSWFHRTGRKDHLVLLFPGVIPACRHRTAGRVPDPLRAARRGWDRLLTSLAPPLHGVSAVRLFFPLAFAHHTFLERRKLSSKMRMSRRFARIVLKR